MTPGDRREDEVAEYWVKMDISRSAALQLLDELANPRSSVRRRLEKDKRSALKVLAEHNIEVAESSLPDEIRLPAPEQVAAFRSQARALVAKDRKPFGFVILAVIFGAMPLVDGAD